VNRDKGKSLSYIASRENVDKARRHNYIPMYEMHMEEKRNLNMNVLEIGIGMGRSLKMWNSYFTNATIIGIDKKEDCLKYVGSRVHSICMDQTDKSELKNLGKTYKVFDFIIDDGSHRSYDQVFSFVYLFEYLREGGVYFIEDTHTSFIDRFAKAKYFGRTCFEYFVDLAKTLNLTKEFPRMDIEYILFYERMIITKKSTTNK
jgi:hypothetical protein